MIPDDKCTPRKQVKKQPSAEMRLVSKLQKESLKVHGNPLNTPKKEPANTRKKIVTIAGRQLRAARALAGLDQAELAKRAHISLATLRRMEACGEESVSGHTTTIAKMTAALENSGIVFIERGVQMALEDEMTIPRDPPNPFPPSHPHVPDPDAPPDPDEDEPAPVPLPS